MKSQWITKFVKSFDWAVSKCHGNPSKRVLMTLQPIGGARRRVSVLWELPSDPAQYFTLDKSGARQAKNGFCDWLATDRHTKRFILKSINGINIWLKLLDFRSRDPPCAACPFMLKKENPVLCLLLDKNGCLIHLPFMVRKQTTFSVFFSSCWFGSCLGRMTFLHTTRSHGRFQWI